jgi:hypothetical protein
MGFGILTSIPKKNFFKASEVDRELECEMHQTKYKVMIGCDMDWPPWRLLILFALVGGMVNLERHTYMRDDVVKP